VGCGARGEGNEVAGDRDKDRWWTRPGVLQGKADEAMGERDKDHQWTRPEQGGKIAGE
jgi:hypothetical protein